RPTGFCAPAWLQTAPTAAAARAEGFRYFTTMQRLVDLEGDRTTWTPSLGHMGAGAAYEAWVARYNALIWTALARRARVVKLCLHPRGSPDSPFLPPVLRYLEQSLERRRPVTFAGLLAERSPGGPERWTGPASPW